MKYFKTEEEKKSLAITTVLFVIMFILFFYLGLTSLDPPPENGIALNFGTTEFGSGDKQPTEAIASAPQPTTAQEATASDDEVLAQDIEEVFPELVSENNGIKSVNYQGLVPVLINALKDQQSEIDELKSMVYELIQNNNK